MIEEEYGPLLFFFVLVNLGNIIYIIIVMSDISVILQKEE